MIDWILKNKEWVFSGIGVAILVVIFEIVKRLLRRRHTNQTEKASVSVVPHGGDHAFGWSFEEGANKTKIMAATGLVEITNLTDHNVRIPNAVLEIAYRRLFILPTRQYIESGMHHEEDIPPRAAVTARLHWFGKSALKRKEAFWGRVVLIDNHGRSNRSRWIDWPFRGNY
jgi:hypothetical protein